MDTLIEIFFSVLEIFLPDELLDRLGSSKIFRYLILALVLVILVLLILWIF